MDVGERLGGRIRDVSVRDMQWEKITKGRSGILVTHKAAII